MKSWSRATCLLVDCEGRSDQVVSIERQADGDLIATWHDASVPVVMRYTPRMRPNWLTFRHRPSR